MEAAHGSYAEGSDVGGGREDWRKDARKMLAKSTLTAAYQLISMIVIMLININMELFLRSIRRQFHNIGQ